MNTTGGGRSPVRNTELCCTKYTAVFDMSAIFQQAVIDSDATKVKFLFKYARGIRIDQANQNGMTALQQASWDGNLELVNFLLENGADLSLVDHEGRSTLHLASQAGHLEVVSLLVNSACADVNARNDRGQKAIDLAKTDQIHALLSQVMLADNLKQRCTVLSPLENDWDNNGCSGSKLSVPGSRFSISSTSTDSGVSEDFVTPPEPGYFDTKCSSYSKAGNALTSEQNHEIPSDLPQIHGKEKNDNEAPKPIRRAINVSAVCSARGKSHSFSGRHDYATIYEASVVDTEKKSPVKVERTSSNPIARERNQRASRDPSRRKTVTFGENESRTISYESSPRPRSSSLRKPTMINYADRSGIPKFYGSAQATRGASAREKDPQIETAGSSPSDARLPPNSQHFTSERNFSRESKHRQHVLPGSLTKTLH